MSIEIDKDGNFDTGYLFAKDVEINCDNADKVTKIYQADSDTWVDFVI